MPYPSIGGYIQPDTTQQDIKEELENRLEPWNPKFTPHLFSLVQKLQELYRTAPDNTYIVSDFSVKTTRERVVNCLKLLYQTGHLKMIIDDDDRRKYRFKPKGDILNIKLDKGGVQS